MSSVPTFLSRFVPNPRMLWRILGLLALYFLVCKLGLKLAVVHPSATAVWPGTGIALAAILLLGYEVWPAIFLGAFAVNVTTAGSIGSSLGIAAGNTLEAVIGSYLVIRFAGGRNLFRRAEGIFKFFFFACAAATAVSATVGTASLVLTGFAQGVPWESLWMTWWLGNMAGAILVTPCVVLWSTAPLVVPGRRNIPRQTAALISLVVVGALVFGGFLSPLSQGYPLKFICIPFVVWVAFELRPREAALAVLAFSVVAIASVLQSTHGMPAPNESLLVMQVFLSIVAMTGLLVSLTVSERNRHEATLQQTNDQLEERVRERTLELENRIVKQENAERALRDLSARLLRAQDEERRRLARELHDSTGQSIAALGMLLSGVRKRVGDDCELLKQLDQGKEIVQSVSDELRTTSYLLHPPLLDEIGLQAGLRWYIEGFQERSNIRVILNIPENLERLPNELELMIFRIVQECLTNVHRHSGSPSAQIGLHCSNEMLILEVRDQGRGMAPERLAAASGSQTVGVGVRGMRERVKSFGGELEISANAGGTTVRAIIPIRQQSQVVLGSETGLQRKQRRQRA